MQCPQCGTRTEVNEKRGPFRERRCTNRACGMDFTTREQIVLERERNLCARTRAIKIGAALPPSSAEVELDAAENSVGMAAPRDQQVEVSA